MPEHAIVEAPSNLGLRPTGVETLPAAVLGAGLAERIGARRAGLVPPLPYDARRDPETGILNPGGIRDYSRRLADALGAALDRGEFPVVLGGDCSILLGSLLALRRRGRFGLLFLDGHSDFYRPENEPLGEAASMELALATGRGPTIVTDIEGRRPLVRDEDVVAFGMRDAAKDPEYAADPLPAGMCALDLAEIRRVGTERSAHEAMAHLSREGGPHRFWIHLDADVLDDAVMPAVDYRMPDGLSWAELESVLRAAVGSGRAAGLEVTIYNPRLDPGGRIASDFVEVLAKALSSSSG
ncbi:MAG: arginase family protein [Thermomicrobiales bacterium]